MPASFDSPSRAKVVRMKQRAAQNLYGNVPTQDLTPWRKKIRQNNLNLHRVYSEALKTGTSNEIVGLVEDMDPDEEFCSQDAHQKYMNLFGE